MAVTSQPFRLTTPQTVAAIVAPIVGVLILAILAFLFWRRRRRQTTKVKTERTADLQIARTNSSDEQQFFPFAQPPEPPSMREAVEESEEWTQDIVAPPRPIRESWMSFGESSRQWVGGGVGGGSSTARPYSLTLDQINDQDDGKDGTLITIKGVFPAEPSSPLELYVPDPRHSAGAMVDTGAEAGAGAVVPTVGQEAGNPLMMNPVIRGGRGPPLRLDTTHWPLA